MKNEYTQAVMQALWQLTHGLGHYGTAVNVENLLLENNMT